MGPGDHYHKKFARVAIWLGGLRQVEKALEASETRTRIWFKEKNTLRIFDSYLHRKTFTIFIYTQRQRSMKMAMATLLLLLLLSFFFNGLLLLLSAPLHSYAEEAFDVRQNLCTVTRSSLSLSGVCVVRTLNQMLGFFCLGEIWVVNMMNVRQMLESIVCTYCILLSIIMCKIAFR